MTLGYVSLAGSSQHSPRATICRYSVAGPAEGRLQTRPIMFCTTSHQHLSEPDSAEDVPECRAGRVLRFEGARAGWWHKPSPRKRETIHRGLRSARSKLAALTQGYNLPLLRSWTNRWQIVNAAENV